MNKFVVDTNILVYAKDKNSQFNSWSLNILTDDRYILFTTGKNLSEYYAVVTRGEKPKLSPNEALEDLKQFIDTFKIIHSTKDSLVVLEKLISANRPKGLKIHDFEIASIALSNGLHGVVTANHRDFKKIENLEIISPEKA